MTLALVMQALLRALAQIIRSQFRRIFSLEVPKETAESNDEMEVMCRKPTACTIFLALGNSPLFTLFYK